jgi:hypothetical protein
VRGVAAARPLPWTAGGNAQLLTAAARALDGIANCVRPHTYARIIGRLEIGCHVDLCSVFRGRGMGWRIPAVASLRALEPVVRCADFGAVAVVAGATVVGAAVRAAAFDGSGAAALHVARARAATCTALLGVSRGDGCALLTPLASQAALNTLTLEGADARLVGEELGFGERGWPLGASPAAALQRFVRARAYLPLPPLSLTAAARFFDQARAVLAGVRQRGGSFYVTGAGRKRRRVEADLIQQSEDIARRNARAGGGLRGSRAQGSDESDALAEDVVAASGVRAAHGDQQQAALLSNHGGAASSSLSPQPAPSSDSSTSSSSSSSDGDAGFKVSSNRGRGRGRGGGGGKRTMAARMAALRAKIKKKK